MPANSKLSRKQPHRDHLLRNLATSIILYEKVDTTKAKAAHVKPIVDRWISLAKPNSLAARRMLLKVVFDELAVKKIFEILLPRYEKRSSGFTRTYNLGARLGDGAQITRIELVDRDIIPSLDQKKKSTVTKAASKTKTKTIDEKKNEQAE